MVMPPDTRSPSSSGRGHAEAEHDPRTDEHDDGDRAIPHRPERAGRPVRSACGRRQRATTRPATAATTTATAACQLPPSYQMALAPRTLIDGDRPEHPRVVGARERVLARRRGRSAPAGRAAARCGRTRRRPGPPTRTMKFSDRRATPMMIPNTVASTMPVIDRRSVFDEALDEGVLDRLGLAERAVGDRELRRLVEERPVGGEPAARRVRPVVAGSHHSTATTAATTRAGTPTPGRGRPATAVADRRSSPSCPLVRSAPRRSAVRRGVLQAAVGPQRVEARAR